MNLLAAPSAEVAHADALWYRDAVIYQLHVKAFFDSNNDGMGDFAGLCAKLDYIQDLGVSAVWLMPFYPSPLRDDGYDVSNYHGVHPQYGTMDDFKGFMREAHRRGLRVITELVMNHTSDQHSWFQAARRAPRGSRKRDYYVWSDSDQKYQGTRIIFSDTETSNWTWDPVAKQYYWHRFFSHQPDLNYDNPSTLKAVMRTMRYWLDLGVDGFRLDAIPYLIEREGSSNEDLPETHALLKQLRARVDELYPDRMLLAEANMWPEDVSSYFGDSDECHMAFHFPLMPRMYMAIAQEDRHPLVEILRQTPAIPESCQWAVFLRNHDELTLETVTSRERDYMYRTYAADMRARINLGIRRRLAPLMENDPERIKLMNSLLLSMPGSPILYYGDEIGMGDNIYLGDRNGMRTPMQWSPDRNAGFSRADPQRLYLPPVMDPVYGYESVNVEAQARDPASLLNWTRRMLATRAQSRAFGRGSFEFLRPGNRKVLAYLREYQDDAILCVANLGRTAQPVELHLERFKGRVPVEMLGRTPFPPVGDLPYLLTLPAHGFYWFRLSKDAPVPAWHKQMVVPEEAPVLVLFDGWLSFFRDRVVPWRIGMAQDLRARLESSVLPRFIAAQRWSAAKGAPVERVMLKDHQIWDEWLLSFVQAGDTQYFLPLATAREEEEERVRALASVTAARIRQKANVGVLADAMADERFVRHLVKAIGTGKDLPTAGGSLVFTRTAGFDDIIAAADVAKLQLGSLGGHSTNTLVHLGERVCLKTYRRLRPGPDPELEIGRFLTEVARFPHCAPLAGAVEYVSGKETCTVALLQGYVRNQGNGWGYTRAYLERFLETRRAEHEPDHGGFSALMHVLGTRTAELHRALGTRSRDPAFDPEPLTAQEIEAWRERVRYDATRTFGLLRQDEQGRAFADLMVEALRYIDRCVMPKGNVVKTRHHGNYHLGQVLVSSNDFVIIDFEADGALPLAESRRKHTPLRDVAGMLRSFSRARWSLEVKEPKLLDSWEKETRRAFLAAYAEASRGAGLFASFEDAAGLLTLAELELLLGDLRHEVTTRSAGLRVALAGAAALLGGSV